MKLEQTITKPLDPGYYEVEITDFYHQETEKHPDGYYVLEFNVTDRQTGNPRKLNIFPPQLEWHLSELVGLAGMEQISDTDELKGKKIKLYFSHSYETQDAEGNPKTVQRKQWQLYKGN